MIARAARSERSGITLTEILIAIMIMGVGLISLATLFPLGLLRMRSATQYGRTGLLFESAADEIDARALLYKSSFIQTWYGPRDPFLYDAQPIGVYDPNTTIDSFSVGLLSGLPVCYDPLFRAITGVVPRNGNPSNKLYDGNLDFKPGYAVTADEARFGAAVFGTSLFNVNADPDSNAPSAYGLQRITNFIPYSPVDLTKFYNFTHQNRAASIQRPDAAADIFTSVDDILFNPVSGRVDAPSPLLPDQSSGSSVADYRFSWFFTGRQVDVNNSSQFIGDIVVCDSRPFGFDSVTINGQTANLPSGEATVEAIFGFGTNFSGTYSQDFARGADRKVLLRWPIGMPDPHVSVGGWIADVTYERNPNVYKSRSLSASRINPSANQIPFVRCHWYQVIKKTEAETETVNSAGPKSAGKYRRIVVTTNTDVRVRTLLYTDTAKKAEPVNSNFALVMPSVINVFPRAFEVH